MEKVFIELKRKKVKNIMKKMIMIATIGLLVSGAQASQINWSVLGVRAHSVLTGSADGITTANTGPAALAGAIVYLFVAPLNVANVNAAIQGGTFSGWDASALTTATSGTGSQLFGSYSTETVKAYMVVFDTATYNATGEGNYMITAEITKTFTTTANQTFAQTFTTASTWTHYNNIPEPTSMALLALGVAAIGLRRKFRK